MRCKKSIQESLVILTRVPPADSSELEKRSLLKLLKVQKSQNICGSVLRKITLVANEMREKEQKNHTGGKIF